MLRAIGLHLRLGDSLVTLAHRAIELSLPIFQCFLIRQETSKLHKPTPQEVKTFVQLREQHFGNLFMHGSYWINLAGVKYSGRRAFDRERILAKQLAFTHMVLHPGSAKGAKNKMEGIDALARQLNDICAKEHELKIVLENTAHGGMTVGSDIADFGVLLAKLDKPERVQFCIDTSHAYAFGYDIVSSDGLEQFVQLLQSTIGIDRIVVLHINDTKHARGARIDQHLCPGEGVLGVEALQAFVFHPQLKHIPLLIEPPVIEPEAEAALMETVRSWHR